MAETALIAAQKFDPKEVFLGDKTQAVLDRIKEEADKHEPDVSTPKGRRAIVSNAADVSKSGTFLEKVGKKITDDIRAETKTKLDSALAARRTIKEFIAALKTEKRRPVTEWEEAEAKRQAAEQAEIGRQADWDDAIKENEGVDTARAMKRELDALREAEAKRKAEAEAAQREKERKEREARIVKEAEERAAKATQDKIDEAVKKAQSEKDKAIKAEADRVAAVAKAEQDRVEAVLQADADRKAAVAKAEQDAKDNADRAERDRIAKEKAEKEAAEKKARHAKHREKVERESREDLAQFFTSDEIAFEVLTCIKANHIRHITINY